MEIAIIQRDGPLVGLFLLNVRDDFAFIKSFVLQHVRLVIGNKRADRTNHTGVKNLSFIA